MLIIGHEFRRGDARTGNLIGERREAGPGTHRHLRRGQTDRAEKNRHQQNAAE